MSLYGRKHLGRIEINFKNKNLKRHSNPMKNKINLIFILAISLVSCKVTQKTYTQTNNTTIQVECKLHGMQESYFSGIVTDQHDGERLPGVMITLSSKTRSDSYGASTDADGKFAIKKVPVGFYLLKVKSFDGEIFLSEVEIKENSNCKADIKLYIKPNMVEKPVIYLYPTQKQKVDVKLNYEGTLTHSYPKYSESGWQVTADPNGNLWDENNKEYYALFWEGIPTQQIVPKDGFVVPGKETAAFLEDKLAYLGLNRREANEFIMYWLPRMEGNPYNFIHFADKEYEAQAKLDISPKPETIIRVMMLTKHVTEFVNMPIQDLTTLKKTRKGFTVVEWGGSVINMIIKEI